MHGDYEAQRHWMEITSQLPISQWYFYDLQYWGLDYPPLTAYHSFLLGKLGSLIDLTWFALDKSRGLEQQLLKVYMRGTVILSEYLVYVPAIIILNRKTATLFGVNKWESYIALAAILMQPATILIDHAHFQYNTVMLGFVLASIACLMSEQFVWSSLFFVAALSFKQMALYYAPVMFSYLLGSCLVPKLNLPRLIAISFMTLLSFGAVLSPMIMGALFDNYRGINPPLTLDDRRVNPLMALATPYLDHSSWLYPIALQLSQVVHRSFPFARGIFEDKVANLWCTLHTFHKLHLYPIPLLQRISLMATLIAILPACMTVSLHPRRELLPWALASCAWAFFLCSFQVHEKSVLLPVLPMTILLSGSGGLAELRAWLGWANVLGAWTMFPLLRRDELRVPYYILTGLWTYLLALPPINWSLYLSPKNSKSNLQQYTKIIHLGFYVAMIFWHILEAFVVPPKSKPDLWVVLNVLIGTVGFGVCYLWCTWNLILQSGILKEYLGYRQEQQAKSKDDRAKALPLPWPLGPKGDSQDKRIASPAKKMKSGSDEGRSKSPELNADKSPRKAGRPKKST